MQRDFKSPKYSIYLGITVLTAMLTVHLFTYAIDYFQGPDPTGTSLGESYTGEVYEAPTDPYVKCDVLTERTYYWLNAPMS